jgi:hypothetical protein
MDTWLGIGEARLPTDRLWRFNLCRFFGKLPNAMKSFFSNTGYLLNCMRIITTPDGLVASQFPADCTLGHTDGLGHLRLTTANFF